MHENNYYFDGPVTADKVLDAAAEILATRALRGDQYCNPEAKKTYLSCKLKHHEREVFAVMFLDNQHRLIAFEKLFFGTIDSASVYPREVLKAALRVNAAALIFAHNHPSGDATPSQADKQITQRLKEALALVDIRVLDHIVVGDSAISFAERGLL
ncbi:DNA repair protein RadC [Vibrio parahaemolyticus]|nr:DNA repair protein RadC [Vibrio parahaemolyticus]HCH1218850.1 DNA repair protein RadC [Vibrio parahaemolyticus]